MLISEWIGLSSMILANAGVGIGIYKYFNSRLEKMDEKTDQKIGGVFKRFDEHKDHISNTYVRKDNCSLLHSTTSDNLKGLEARIEKRFDKLDGQIAQLLNK